VEIVTVLFAIAFIVWLVERRDRNELFGDQPCRFCDRTIRWDGGRKVFVHKATGEEMSSAPTVRGWPASTPHPALPYWGPESFDL
jgi:hypothetical protein